MDIGLRLLLAYAGGVLTILSPCILPVLPFVFARADRPFRRSGLPLLAGMAATFALTATLAAVGAGWAVAANRWGRIAALVLLALFGVTLLVPAVAERMTRPLVALGSRLNERADAGGSEVGRSFLLGIATGLLWAPCAGPILGLILTGAALNGPNVGTTLLLAAYAAGAATSLALALLVGGRVFAAMKRSLGVGEWIRRLLGAAVLVGVAAIALGVDTQVLTQVSLGGTTRLEGNLLHWVRGEKVPVAQAGRLPDLGPMPPLDGAVAWLNSPPLTATGLRGKVVLVDFWTYSCINCLRTLPYVRAWDAKYRHAGLVIIGVHTPEFAFERQLANVRKAVADLHIAYPVAVDSRETIWNAFRNDSWPADYFVDANGRIRAMAVGEGDYDTAERTIQQLLREAGRMPPGGLVHDAGRGAEAAADLTDDLTQETYLGSDRADKFASPGGAVAGPHAYTVPKLGNDQWALDGSWTVTPSYVTPDAPRGAAAIQFSARDLHMVLGPPANGAAHFHVTLDGKPPGADHGVDCDASGAGVVTGQRLYQLVRQRGTVGNRLFRIEFDEPGAQAYTFTFG